ncbi:hypothetical protein EJB05_55088, partial [Eragrostis curvula]
MDLPALDFSPGLGQQAEILRRFGSPVNFSPGYGLSEFFLVLSVGRCKFRLTGDLIARILQAILGGNAEFFKVSQLGDRVFKFSVASKKVGFYIYNLKSYECDAFKVLFHLWGHGGPQSQQEASRWESEQDAEWTTVTYKKNRGKRSYVDAVKSASVLQHKHSRPSAMDHQKQQGVHLTGANTVPILQQQTQRNNNQVPVSSVFSRINEDLQKAGASSVFDQWPRKTVFDRLEFPDGSSSEEQGRHSKSKSDLQSDVDGGMANQIQNSNIPSATFQQPVPKAHGLLCVRCLRTNHTREACRSSIKCHSCGLWGHIAVNCRSPKQNHRDIQKAAHLNQERNQGTQPKRTRLEYRPKSKQATVASDTGTHNKERLQNRNPVRDRNRGDFGLPSQDIDLELRLENHNTRPPPLPSPRRQPPTSPELPVAQVHQSSSMAYNHVDPTPFLPRHFHRVEVPGRAVMARMIGGRAPPRNEEIGIAIIDPMPDHQVQFANIHDVLDDFFRLHLRVRIRDIQPCPFGQAYVKFDTILDRDRIADAGYIAFDDVHIRVIRHNEAANRSRVTFEREVWLMLIGFPLDYWHLHYVESAISSFGKVQVWEQDNSNLARIICEIINETPFAPPAPNEEPVPDIDDVGDDMPFDFFGFGQIAHGNAPEPVNPNAHMHGPEANNWGIWPAQPQEPMAAPAAAEQPQEPMVAPAAADNQFDHGLNINNIPDAVNNIEEEDEDEDIEEIIVEGPDVPEQLVEPEPQVSLSLTASNASNSGSSVSGNSAQQVEQANVPDINMPLENNDMVIDAVQPQLQQAVLPQLQLQQVVHHEALGPVLDFDLNDPAPAEVIAAQMEIEEEAPEQIAVQNLQLNINIQENENLQEGEGHLADQQIPAQVDEVQPQLPPMNFDNLLHDELEDQQQGPPQQQGNNQHLHVGFMEFADQATVDPVFESFVSPAMQSSQKKINADIYRLCAKYFSPNGSSNAVVEVPADWLSFFTTMLLSPTHFSWAKNFLSSKAWDIVTNRVDCDRGLKFSLPLLCPKDGPVPCLTESLDEAASNTNIEQTDASTTAATDSETSQDINATPLKAFATSCTTKHSNTVPVIRKKISCKVAIVETDVRRSDRLKKRNEGFKANSCSRWDCVACTNEPPVLTPSLIKDLGTSFAQVAPEGLNEQTLQKKRKSKTTIGRHDNEASSSTTTEDHKGKKSKAVAGKKSNPSDANGSKKSKK